MNRSKHLVYFSVVLSIIAGSFAQDFHTGYKLIKRVYDQCEQNTDTFKCLKIQALKLTDRALHAEEINVIDGISLVKTENSEGGRSMDNLLPLPTMQLSNMRNNEIDNLLMERVTRFVENHKVQFAMPRSFDSVEGRGKMKKYMGPLMAAVMIKGGLLTMAFKGVALLAGKALLLGKIALVLSTILAIKKLFSNEGHEKTTYEIVKHPQVTHSQSYSSSHYNGDYESGGGHYHRSLETPNEDTHEQAYSAYAPNGGY